MILKLPAILDGSHRLKDNSYSLRFVSGLEVGKEQRSQIDDCFQNEGWLIFAANEDEVEVPKEKAETGRKSETQILNGRMWVAWDNRVKKGKTTADFETWRKNQLQSIGQQYLNELDNN